MTLNNRPPSSFNFTDAEDNQTHVPLPRNQMSTNSTGAANLPKDRMAQAKLVLRPQTPPQLLPLRASQRTIIRQAISPKAAEANRLKMGKVSLQGETESLAYDC